MWLLKLFIACHYFIAVQRPRASGQQDEMNWTELVICPVNGLLATSCFEASGNLVLVLFSPFSPSPAWISKDHYYVRKQGKIVRYRQMDECQCNANILHLIRFESVAKVFHSLTWPVSSWSVLSGPQSGFKGFESSLYVCMHVCYCTVVLYFSNKSIKSRTCECDRFFSLHDYDSKSNVSCPVSLDSMFWLDWWGWSKTLDVNWCEVVWPYVVSVSLCWSDGACGRLQPACHCMFHD